MGLVLVPIEQRRSCQLQVQLSCCTNSMLIGHALKNEVVHLQSHCEG